jgi:hypothetical protein
MYWEFVKKVSSVALSAPERADGGMKQTGFISVRY